jgi:UDP-N-acetylenolpyruvoylglucosamine reductase
VSSTRSKQGRRRDYILNDQHGTASDVLALLSQIKQAAREKRGLTLETEVQILGEEERTI